MACLCHTRTAPDLSVMRVMIRARKLLRCAAQLRRTKSVLSYCDTYVLFLLFHIFTSWSIILVHLDAETLDENKITPIPTSTHSSFPHASNYCRENVGKQDLPSLNFLWGHYRSWTETIFAE